MLRLKCIRFIRIISLLLINSAWIFYYIVSFPSLLVIIVLFFVCQNYLWINFQAIKKMYNKTKINLIRNFMLLMFV